MRKRIGALGLAAALLLAMICPALAAGTTFVVKGPDQAPRKGETFTVTVELENNPGFNSVEFTLVFDSKMMTCKEISIGEVLGEALSASNPNADEGARVAAASADVLFGDGQLAQFSFVANEDLAGTDFGLSRIRFADQEGKAIPYQASNEIPGGEKNDASAQAPVSDPEPTQEPQTSPVSDPGTVSQQKAPFTDTEGHWGEGYIARAAELGLFRGYPDGSFLPDQNVTRAQYVTVLYRMDGSPAVASEAPFTDISDQSQEFRTAIAWGYENGYLNGKGDGIFDPSGPVTRQEAMKILYGYAGGVSGMEILFTADYDAGFADSAELASWGKAPMYWGVFNSIISGTGDNMLSPQGTATRAQLAKILTGYYDRQNKNK